MKTQLSQACRCRMLRVSGSSSFEVTYACRCGKTRVTRPCTKEETKRFRKELLAPSKIHDLHRLFDRTFKKPAMGGYKLVGKKKMAAQKIVFDKKMRIPGIGDWRWTGFDLMTRVARFANKHPEISIARVDDDHFCGSDMVFIPHQDEHQLWGITVLYIPQCTGEKPIKFFMYPGHVKGILQALHGFSKIGNAFGRDWSSEKESSLFDQFEPVAKKNFPVQAKR